MTYPESIMKPARLIADRWADDDNTEECAEDIAALVMAERERCAGIVEEHVNGFRELSRKHPVGSPVRQQCIKLAWSAEPLAAAIRSQS